MAVFFLIFAMLNREVVSLDLAPFPAVIEMRLFIFVGFLILIGTFLGWVVSSFECRRRYLIKKNVQKRITALENEIATLRARHTLPDTASAPDATAAQHTPILP
ncbi:MAG: LapA family protein [Alphaproteobacteria bacterium]|nr:LapA family protein [Alphaproteobacteria bacterium]